MWHDLCAVSGGEGEVPGLPSAGCVLLSDGSYQANGALEEGEPGIGGVLVQIGSGACPAVGQAVATTDTGGNYTFSGLTAGTYCVSVDATNTANAAMLPGYWSFPLVVGT